MNAISRTDLLELIQDATNQCVSIFMPIEPPGREDKQNLIRYRKLVDRAQEMLIEKGVSKSDAEAFFASARSLQEKPLFWQALHRGLAILLSPGGLRVWHLPIACDEQCYVGKQFHILPLLTWLNQSISYWLILVSQSRVRLLRVTENTLEEIQVPALASSCNAALNYDRRQGTYQFHSGNPQLRGKEGLVFTGQGGSVDAEQVEIAEFIRAVEEPISDFLHERSEPLIFVGVDDLYPLYQRHNRYPHLAEKHISGNPDLYSNNELQRRAQPILEALVSARQRADVLKYWERIGHGHAANRIEEIFAAAEAGAVETLFIDPKAKVVGVFDRRTESVRIDGCTQHESEDLVNLAAILVLQHGGDVLTPELGNVPGGGPMAAALRYPVSAAAMMAAK